MKSATSLLPVPRCNANLCRSSYAVSWNELHPGPPAAHGCKEFVIARKLRELVCPLPAYYAPGELTGRDSRR